MLGIIPAIPRHMQIEEDPFFGMFVSPMRTAANALPDMRKAFDSGFMPVDIKQDEHGYEIEVDIPGAEKDDISIDYDNGVLAISYEKSEQSEESQNDSSYCVRERHSCSMKRNIPLDGVDGEKASAKYENGVLKVSLPKLQEDADAKKKIDIE